MHSSIFIWSHMVAAFLRHVDCLPVYFTFLCLFLAHCWPHCIVTKSSCKCSSQSLDQWYFPSFSLRFPLLTFHRCCYCSWREPGPHEVVGLWYWYWRGLLVFHHWHHRQTQTHRWWQGPSCHPPCRSLSLVHTLPSTTAGLVLGMPIICHQQLVTWCLLTLLTCAHGESMRNIKKYISEHLMMC